MSCAVRSCRNEVQRRPDLSFFNLPTHQDVREEWLEVLGVDRPDFMRRIKVCELHFKPKDFCEGRKQLKSHAIPVLKLGAGNSDIIDSDDEFMEYKSDSDQEIMEISNSRQSNGRVKKEEQETPTKTDDEEPTEGRRPSRRAAREAAKKIYNTVRSFMPKAGDDVYVPPIASPLTFSRSPNTANRPKKRQVIKIPPVEIDLVMECYEEILSPVQAEALLKSQSEYNMVMKTLRSLKASNAKIIFSKEPYTGVVPPAPVTTVPTPRASVVPLKLANNPAIQITKTTVPA